MVSTDNSNGMFMPVAPYGGYGNDGGFGWWIILLLLCGWGNGGCGGNNTNNGAALYPWMNQADITTSGFQNQMLNTAVMGVQNAVTSGFGDVQTALCGGFAGVNATINGTQNALAQQLYNNQISDLERSFAAQTANTQGMNALQAQLAQCCCDNRLATCQTQNVVQSEAATTRSVIQGSVQAVLDKLCQLELDGVKNQLAQAQRENIGLQNQVNMATMQASQTAQTAQILAGQASTANGLVTELRSCPIPSQPVYGNQPIFTCGGNVGCGCGGNSGFVN